MSAQQPFEDVDIAAMKDIAARYEQPASAILPLLHYVQRLRGHLDQNELVYVADFLKVPHVRAYEVATYYTMFFTQPVGRHLIQVCRNLPCTLDGGPAVLAAIRNELGIGPGETTEDGAFSMVEVECIGACDLAPAIMVDDELHGRVTPDSVADLLDRYRER